MPAVFAGLIASLAAALMPIRMAEAPLLIPQFDIWSPKVHLLFVGDIMGDRSIRTHAREKGWEHIFSCIKDELASYDAVIGNLEGPITEHASVSEGTAAGDPGNTRFTFPGALASVLRAHNIRAVSLGNNHIRDFGMEGVASTKAALDGAGVVHFGAPGDKGEGVALLDIAGVKVSLIGFNDFLGTPEETVRNIQHAPAGVPVIVFAHWGEEYVPATERERSLARTFIAAGADLIIGAHPHVIQEYEEVDGVPVFYSLGNFVFDQYWNEEVRTGMGAEVTLSRDGVIATSSRLFYLEQDRRTCPHTFIQKAKLSE